MTMVDHEPVASSEPERLGPNEVLLFPQPAFLVGLAVEFNRISAAVIPGRNDLVAAIERLSCEYEAIANLLARVVGVDKMRLVKNELRYIYLGVSDLSNLDLRVADVPGFESVRFRAKFEKANIWPRDVFSRFGNLTVVDTRRFSVDAEGDEFKKPSFGEGGRVLSAGKAVIVHEELWKIRKEDPGYPMLLENGFKVATLPYIDLFNQPYFGDVHHIDSSIALVENDRGDLLLAVGKSYAFQGNGTRKQLRIAAETVGADLAEIDDSDFVPLAFNLIQFRDGSVVMTSGADALAEVLSKFLGEDKVFQTDVPIAFLPTIAGGGIRCLTNIVDMKTLLRICEI